MLIFTIRNAVILALMQVGVIVAGVLASATTAEVLDTWTLMAPGVTQTLINYGIWMLLLPLAWITAAVRLRRNSEVSDEVKLAVFLLGIGLLILIFMVAWSGAIGPFFKICSLTFAE